MRAKIILMTAEGKPVQKILRQLQISKITVTKWKQRFLEKGVPGLVDLPRPGRPPAYGPEIRHRIAAKACNPPSGRTRWTIRDLAKHLGVNKNIVERVLKDEAIKPHRVK